MEKAAILDGSHANIRITSLTIINDVKQTKKRIEGMREKKVKPKTSFGVIKVGLLTLLPPGLSHGDCPWLDESKGWDIETTSGYFG